MHVKALFLTLTFSLQTFVTSTSVKFFDPSNGCTGSPIDEYRTGCNQCVETAAKFNRSQLEILEISDNQKFSVHNTAGCTPVSSIGQWHGAKCVTAGTESDPIRSVWVSCPDEKFLDNSTHSHS